MDDDLAAFCLRERPRLVSAVDLVTGSLGVAEDLAQETLARVCRDWRRVREMDAPGAYAHRIALNLATSMFRRRAAERRARDRDSARATRVWHDPDGAERVAVRAALQSLRPEQRQVLVARYFLGYSLLETARLLRMPEGTVKTHAHRGLALLREQLGADITATEAVPHA